MSSDITVYTLRITEKKEMLAAYMPFVKNGGVFLKSAQHPMGSSVAVILEIPNDDHKYSVIGKVVWVSQRDARQEGGVGIQFPETPEGAALKSKIDVVIGGMDRAKEKSMTV